MTGGWALVDGVLQRDGMPVGRALPGRLETRRRRARAERNATRMSTGTGFGLVASAAVWTDIT
jgi:hypothetical protein